MDFSKLRHRVIFLKPLDKRLNSMNENVPLWIPFKPKLSGEINADETSVCVLTDNKGNALWCGNQQAADNCIHISFL